MSRTHAEIQRLSDRIGTHVALADASSGIQADQIEDLLACLYGLYALLRLHFLQEEENYFTLTDIDSHADDRRPVLDDQGPHRKSGASHSVEATNANGSAP